MVAIRIFFSIVLDEVRWTPIEAGRFARQEIAVYSGFESED